MLRTADKNLILGRNLIEVPDHYESYSSVAEGEVTASSGGTGVVPGGVAHTKTAWVELVASSSIRADGFVLDAQIGDVAVADYLIDIGIGGAGSEVAIVSNILWTSGGGDGAPANAFFPIQIPAGSRIVARAQSTDTTGVRVNLIIHLVKGGFAKDVRCRVATTYGANTGTSGGTAVNAGGSTNTKGAYSELSAALSFGFESCVLCLGNRNNAAQTGQNMLLDLALGAAAAEVVLYGDMYVRVMAVSEDVMPKWTWLPISAKAGQRLATRIQSSSNDATDRIIDAVVIGFS